MIEVPAVTDEANDQMMQGPEPRARRRRPARQGPRRPQDAADRPQRSASAHEEARGEERPSCTNWFASTSRPSAHRPRACGMGKGCPGSSSRSSSSSSGAAVWPAALLGSGGGTVASTAWCRSRAKPARAVRAVALRRCSGPSRARSRDGGPRRPCRRPLSAAPGARGWNGGRAWRGGRHRPALRRGDEPERPHPRAGHGRRVRQRWHTSPVLVLPAPHGPRRGGCSTRSSSSSDWPSWCRALGSTWCSITGSLRHAPGGGGRS